MRIGTSTSKAVEILRGARELISEREHWTRRAFARNKSGDAVNVSSPEAHCFCSVGAIRRVGSRMRDADALDNYMAENMLSCELRGGSESVPSFNDSHTHEEVLALFDKVIGKMEGEAA